MQISRDVGATVDDYPFVTNIHSAWNFVLEAHLGIMEAFCVEI